MRHVALLVAGALLQPGAAALAGGAAPIGPDQPGVVEDVLAILHDRGLVDEAEYTRLAGKHRSWIENRQVPRIQWSGDFRGRLEQFWLDRDALGDEPGNRTRARYRLRLRAQARVNEYLLAVARIASGQESSRSTNRTLGFRTDFDPDALFIDHAYLDLQAPEAWLPLGRARVRFGKMPVPFRWKHGPDSMLWDRDLSPEGVALEWSGSPAEAWGMSVRAAYLIADENAGSRDPHVLGLQAGASYGPHPDWEAGARVSAYHWRSLDPDFLDRAARSGNLRIGLNGSANGGSGLLATELAAYFRWKGFARWPVLVYAHVVQNHDATHVPAEAGTADDDLGVGLGFSVGDKREILELGLGYFRMEANAWPSQFVDAPLLGGRTNQEAWVLHGIREILPGTELKVTLFVGDALETDPAYASSLPGGDRVQLQTDLMVRF